MEFGRRQLFVGIDMGNSFSSEQQTRNRYIQKIGILSFDLREISYSCSQSWAQITIGNTFLL